MKGCPKNPRLATWLLLAVVTAWLPGAASGADPDAWIGSEAGHYRLAFQPDIDPLTINRMHGWTLFLTDAGGRPLADARIEVSGGMPAHDHGLPSVPRVTEALGRGRYRLEGMRFHMPGVWEVIVTVDVDGIRDRVVVPLTL